MARPAHPYFLIYLTVSLTATGVHALLGPQARAVTYVLIAGGALVPLVRGLRGGYMTARPANWLLVLAMAVLGVGNVCASLAVLWRPGMAVGAEIAISLGHLLALASALSTAAIRGRNDLGGLIDVAVVSMAGGGLLWTAVIQPRLVDTGAGSQIGLLVNILVLTGVLGTLARLAQTAAEPIVSIRLILAALVLALVGNVAMAMTVGSLTVGRPVWAEVAFLTTYTLLGAIGVHPSTLQFAETPPARNEPLSPRRLAFLGVAMAVGPVVGAGRELLGFAVDGPLLALGTLSTVPLVMLRIGYLSAKRNQAERELTHQATHDPLTGLVNRAEVLRRLDDALARRAAGGGNDVLVMFADLDGFKAVNDRLGHAVGDDLLAAVARRLRGLVAARDTLARYGGDEFLLLVETSNPVAAQASIGRRIRAALAAPFDLAEARDVRVGISLGAVVADRGDLADALVSRADSQMYAAKQRRRGGLAASA
ncbi:hypothetical protein GCM10010124_13650 [Pilimelia terevasa]|uniref:GGDEF domain-containing protein n=1 Tax=Pilimelia terevasa TaxID=53372 RepID=A0A8J3BMV9_9ACTN|nr:GGDEF domain-containing protein [Pilimelia terevasa]GGK22423.1 hypothetical protein GCM10010124_13650 [Pilimelia terevasa]